jgi:hypothetical protein
MVSVRSSAREAHAAESRKAPTMKRFRWPAIAAAAILAVALLAGKDDIRRFRRMYGM